MRQGFLRIIAGKWRGRRLKVLTNVKDLRPTPDRVRETLFNWLAPVIHHARCLDLFSGSGILGFEALSRGAAYVIMVDESKEVISLIQSELKDFGAENAFIYRAKIPKGLSAIDKNFDIVFIDPPYQSSLLLSSCHYLEEHGYLSDSAYIYLEANRLIKDNDLPTNWKIIKSKHAGQVFYYLAHREIKKSNEQ